MVLAFFHPWAAFLMWVKRQKIGSDHQGSVVVIVLDQSCFSKLLKTLRLKCASKNTLGFTSTCLCVYIQHKQMVCIQQFLPCGVMICAGLAGALTFHVVRVPSEWLQTNCLPSWCQATEWMALKTQHHISIQKQTDYI